MLILYIPAGIFALVAIFLLLKIVQLSAGNKKTETERNLLSTAKLTDIGTVSSLSFLPLVDYISSDEALKTEPGVSYLIRADGTSILLDVGYNSGKEHPSPSFQIWKPSVFLPIHST